MTLAFDYSGNYNIQENKVYFNREIDLLKDTFLLKNILNIQDNECSTIGSYAFIGCYSLQSVNFPNCSTIGQAAFKSCTLLQQASFSNCSAIRSSAFYGCSLLQSIYLLSTSVCTLANTNAFYYTPISSSTYIGKFGSIYVPFSLVSAYKTATYWSTYSSRITSYVG